MNKLAPLSLSALIATVLFTTCDFDQGLGPMQSKIRGNVYFIDTESRPQNVEEVRVVALASLPPKGIADIFFSDALDFSQDTVAYEIVAPLGTYEVVAALWKPRGEDWSLTSLLGFYGLNLSFDVKLLPVDLTSARPVADSVDMLALWGFANFDGRVEGTIAFRGELPADTETEIIILGAFTQIPRDPRRITNWLPFLAGIDVAIPTDPGVQSHHYRMAVRNGEHQFVGLFWKGTETDWNDLKVIGFYRDRDDPNRPGKIRVAPDSTISNIDFIADFDSLPEGLRIGDGR